MKIRFLNTINFLSNNKLQNGSYASKKMDIKPYCNDSFAYTKSEKLNKPKVNDYSMKDNKSEESAKKVVFEKYKNNEKLANSPVAEKYIGEILNSIKGTRQGFIAYKILSDEFFYNNPYFMDYAAKIIETSDSDDDIAIKIYFLDKISKSKKAFEDNGVMSSLAKNLSRSMSKFEGVILEKATSTKRLYTDKIFMDKLSEVKAKDQKEYERIIGIIKNNNLSPKQMCFLFGNPYFSASDIEKLNKTMGMDKADLLDEFDMGIAAQFLDYYKINNLRQLSIYKRRSLLKKLINENSMLFLASTALKKYFPIIPTSQSKYCETIPELVDLIHIKPEKLNKNKIKLFESTCRQLTNLITELNSEDLDNLDIKQQYSVCDFTNDILNELKDKSDKEIAEICHHFSFELYPIDKSENRYELLGYPQIIKNENYDKTDPKTIKNIKNLVLKFNQSEISCNNKELEAQLNELLNILPELRTTLNNQKPSKFEDNIKLLKEITADSEYNNLSDSDKKIIFLACFMRNIINGSSNGTEYQENCGVDAYFISNKLGLSEQDREKLYAVIKSLGWQKNLQNSENKIQYDKLNSIAYDLRYDSEFTLSKILEGAILKTENKYDEYKNQFNLYCPIIEYMVNELKSNQPILPITKIPSADRINKAISEVNEDGSTNVKGVYKDKDGLIIIKFNEVENNDWEKIGFRKGNISRGVKVGTPDNKEINTGNIKFLTHGLTFEQELANFEAFSMINSDAILSTSYAEFPESKYHFFRPQGLILDCSTKNIHAGGASAMLSGYKKTIEGFKKNYLLNGSRKHDRSFISDLIKKFGNLKDEDYRDFVQSCSNKEISEMKSSFEKIIWNYIFQNLRKTSKYKGEYNEILISNPKPPMAIYISPENTEEIYKNPIELLNSKKADTPFECNSKNQLNGNKIKFLRKYALKHNIPFIVFGE